MFMSANIHEPSADMTMLWQAQSRENSDVSDVHANTSMNLADDWRCSKRIEERTTIWQMFMSAKLQTIC
jgi:hypothetical protein